MKQTIAVFLLISILMLFSGCVKKPKDKEIGDTDFSHENNKNTNSNSNSTSESGQSSQTQGGGDAALTMYTSYSDYLKFLKATKLPQNFISFDMISDFGNFRKFQCASSGGMKEYLYAITDPIGGAEILVSVKHNRNLTSSVSSVAEKDLDSKDLRFLNSKDGGTKLLVHKGIQYTYVNGEILSAKWMVGNVYFSVSGDLSQYSIKNETAISKLLCLDAAYEVIDAIEEKLK